MYIQLDNLENTINRLLSTVLTEKGSFANTDGKTTSANCKPQPSNFVSPPSNFLPTFADIPVARVIYSGNTTIVYFTDNTYVIVNCSKHDNYDRQTAIAYAILKRLFGKIGKYDKKAKKFNAYEIDGNGLGLKLEKIANAGYDQDLEKKNLAANKAAAKEAHISRQKAEHDAAWQKRVEKRAEQIRLEREATALADRLAKTNNKKLIFEDVNSNEHPPMNDSMNASMNVSTDAWKLYCRPNKPFSMFTDEEKREYWRYHNAKRRHSK